MIVLDPDLDPDPAPAPATKVHASGIQHKTPLNRVPSARVLARFLTGAQSVVRLRGEVTVLLTTDTAMRRLNRRFRGKNQATDVLSFPAGPMPGHTKSPAGRAMAGDLAISVPTAHRQAVEQGHSLTVEIEVLMLHGLLHLAGYDHEADDGKMASRERLLRARLGLPQGLIERADSANRSRPSKKQWVPSPEGAPSPLRPGKPQKPAPKKVGPIAGGAKP
jgi:probable rRNA maturation factor